MVTVRKTGQAPDPERPPVQPVTFVPVEDLTPKETRVVAQARVFAEPSAAGLERRLNAFLVVVPQGDLISVNPSFSHQGGQVFYIAIVLYRTSLESAEENRAS